MTPWTVALQAPLSIEFSRQECWSGWPCPSPGDLPDPGIELPSPALQADSLLYEQPGKPVRSKENSKYINADTAAALTPKTKAETGHSSK